METKVHHRADRATPHPFSLPDPIPALAGGHQQAVFVIGAPRSGTTLLYKLLCLHPEAVWLSNYVRRAPRIVPLGALGRIASRFPSARDRSWFEDGQAYRYGTKRPLTEWLFPAPVEGEPFFARCGLGTAETPTQTDEPTQRFRLRRAVRSLCIAHGGSVFVSKRIAHNQRLPVLASAFPNARFVHLVRDGRDVASSLSAVDWWPTSHLDWYGGTVADWTRAGHDPLEAAARVWVEELAGIEVGLNSVDPSRTVQLRYEDLLADPEPIVQRICGFVGLETTPAMQKIVNTLRPSLGQSRFTSSERALIDEIQGTTLRKFGYGCSESDRSSDGGL